MTLNRINNDQEICTTNCSTTAGRLDRLERAVRGSCDGMWEWDLQTNQVWFAPRYLELLGMISEEFPAELESWRRQVHPDDVDTTWGAIERHIDTAELLDIELRMATKGGNYRWFRARATAYYNEQDKAMLVAGSIQDIDDLKRTEQMFKEKEAQLLQQQKMEAVGKLAGGVAHEFNNLLQAIRGYTVFAQVTLDADSQAYEDLQQVITASEQATMLTRQLLNFSRPEASNSRVCVIDKIVVDLECMLRPLLPENIGFRLELAQLEQFST